MIILVLLFFLFVVGFIAVVWALIFRAFAKQKVEGHEILAQVGSQVGLRCDRGVLWGTLRGHEVRARATGLHGEFSVAIKLNPPLDLGLVLQTRNCDYEFGMVGHGPDFLVNAPQQRQLGDPAIDRAYEVSVDEPARLAALLSVNLRQLLSVSFGEQGGIRVTDLGVELRQPFGTRSRHYGSWRHTPPNPADLAGKLDFAAQLAEQLSLARTDVPAAAALAQRLEAWRSFAAAHGLQGASCPLSVWGELQGISLQAFAQRTSAGQHQATVFLRFSSPLQIGLTLGPQREAHRTAMPGWDVPLGDAPFDEAFLVQIADSMVAMQVLTTEVRRQLLALQQRFGTVWIDDQGMQLSVQGVTDPAEIPRVVDSASAVLRTMWDNAKAASSVGPYR